MKPTNQEIGAIGLSFTVVGEAAQCLARLAVDRGNVTQEHMVEFLTSKFDEDEFWERFGGPATDWFEDSASGES